MSGVIEVITKPPFRDLRGRFTRATQELLDDRREMLRKLGRRWVEYARGEAPFRTGEFRKSIIYRTYQSGNILSLKSYAAQPLGRWIIEGTAPHIITPRNRKMLRFQVGGRTVFTRLVHHPGTKPNPYHRRAYSKWQPEARLELRRITRDFVEVLKGRSA